MSHFLNLNEIAASDLREILDHAQAIKSKRADAPKGERDEDAPLSGRIVALIFEKPSTRTRVSFEVGIRQMGGDVVTLSGRDMQLGHGETIADTARVLSRYVDLIMIRTFDEETLIELAEHANVPVINGLTNISHPCQIMADLMSFEERIGPVAGRRIIWLGDGNNVCASYIHAAPLLEFDFEFCGPPSLAPDPKLIEDARAQGANIRVSAEPEEAVKGADLLVTDAWVSMHDKDSTRQRRHNILRPFQVNPALMAAAGEQAHFTHCLPAHRGEEVTSDVLDGERSLAFDAAENRLHVQKAIMRWCLGV